MKSRTRPALCTSAFREILTDTSDILYISVLVSSSTHAEVRKNYPGIGDFAVQKFNRLVAEGLACNGAKVKALSVFFLPKGLWKHKKESERGVDYKYIPSFPYPLVRYPFVILFCFFYVFFWGLFHKKNKVLMCDVLNVSACMGAVAAASILGLKSVGIMTDMPGLMVTGRGSKNIFSKVLSSRCYLEKFTHYVFLTEQMNEINMKKKPYIVMEGLVAPDVKVTQRNKYYPRTIVYAGSLYAKYGLRLLIDAVKSMPQNDIQLVLYGNGPIVEELKSETDPRIVYKGMASNDLIVEAEQKATLLVNPRPTSEAFVKYSFPSKNMEYMLSGTPLLTTRLPGMPQEYYPFVYLFDEETTESYAKTLHHVLSLSDNELTEKGAKARRWVIERKNNKHQAGRILKMLEN